jgi:hypothetical protein
MPIEPAVEPRPSARLLRVAGAARPITANTTAYAVPLWPRAAEHAEPERKHDGIRGQRCDGEPCEIHEPADQNHRASAVAISQQAGERLRQAPDQILQRHRDPEGLAGEAEIDGDGTQEQARYLSHAHRQRDHQRATDDDNQPRWAHV